LFDNLTAKPAVGAENQTCRFTREELQLRHDTFARKVEFYEAMIEHRRKDDRELRDRLREEKDAGKVALLTVDLKKNDDDYKEYLEKHDTANRGVLRSRFWLDNNAESGLWKELDDINPETL
jgi:hypothetical protein